jgi:hypothetical protein
MFGTAVFIPDYEAIRTRDNYLYVEYVTGERELYNLQNDPYQLQNIYSTANPVLLGLLAQQLNILRNCAGATCR